MDFDYEHYPLSDELDNEVIMHRNAHFGGKFDIMLEYYSQEGKGAHPDITLDKIEELLHKEHEMQEDIGMLLLSEAENEKVEESKAKYQQLRSIYNVKNSKTPLPALIADLILTENPEPEEEIQALVEHGEAAVAFLHDIMKSDELYDPLFPGYGYAPIHAAECLGKIGSHSSIRILFEQIGTGTFANEEAVFHGLKCIGKKAESFLWDIIKSRPIRPDTEKAVIAILEFPHHEETAKAFLEMLQEEGVKAYPSLMLYLIFGCEDLKDKKLREQFASLKSNIPVEFHQDMDVVIRNWK